MAETPAVPVDERAQAPAGAAAASDVFLSPLAMPPTRSALLRSYAALLLIALAFGAVAPFAHVQWPAYTPFILIFDVAIALNNFYTAALLLSQYNGLRRRCLLVLAGAYLFVALIVIPYTFSFPGLMAPGLQLGSRSDAVAWLFAIWHAAFPLALIGYSLLRDRTADVALEYTSAWRPIVVTMAIVAGALIVLTWLVSNPLSLFPHLVVGNRFTTLNLVIVYVNGGLSLVAFGLLWVRHRRSLLDLWLTIVAAAWLASMGIFVFSAARFDLGWYGARIVELAASSVLLIVLLAQTGSLNATFAHAALRERDVRERYLREAQERLVHLSRLSAIRHIVTMLTGEMRHRLAAATAILVTGAASTQSGDTSQLAAECQRAGEQVMRSTKLVERLSDYARTEEMTRRNEDLASTIEEVATLALARADRPARQFEIHIQPHCSWALIDRAGIQEVLFCLIANAIEATRDSRKRRIVVDAVPAENDMIEVCVADSGRGVASEVRDRIFEPFVTTKPDTAAVGLSVSRAIVEQHGGRLWLSKSDASGATFCFTVPRGKEVAAGIAADERGLSSATRVRIVSSAD